MKCTKCKKIIPSGEELFKNQGYYHEDCQKQVEIEIKAKNEITNKKITNFAIAWFVFMPFLFSTYYFDKKTFKNEDQKIIVQGIFALLALASLGWLIRCGYLLLRK